MLMAFVIDILIAIGLLGSIVSVVIGKFMGLKIAFNQGSVIGLLCPFIPFVTPIYLYLNKDEINKDSTRTACKFYFGGIAALILVWAIGITLGLSGVYERL